MSAIASVFNRVDILMQIFKYLAPRNAYHFGMATKFFYSIYRHDILWQYYVEIQFAKFVPLADIAALSSLYMACLRIPNMMIFYSIFEHLSFDLIGNFRAKSKLPKGKFIRIIPVNECSTTSLYNDQSAPIEYTFAMEEYELNGSLIKTFHIFYDEVTNKLIAVNNNNNNNANNNNSNTHHSINTITPNNNSHNNNNNSNSSNTYHSINTIAPSSHRFTTLDIHSDHIELSFLPSNVSFTKLYRLPNTANLGSIHTHYNTASLTTSIINRNQDITTNNNNNSNNNNYNNMIPYSSSLTETTLNARRNHDVVTSLTHCQGFFTSLYGGHGMELIHVSIIMQDPRLVNSISSTGSSNNSNSNGTTTTTTNTNADNHNTNTDTANNADTNTTTTAINNNHNDANVVVNNTDLTNAATTTASSVGSDTNDTPLVSYPRLQALKVTGDPNICAGRHTFLIDLSLTTLTQHSIHPITAIANNTRPIVLYDHHGNVTQINLLQERLPRIVAWYAGYGQINRTPDNPVYEWVGCQFIVYAATHTSNNNNNNNSSHSSSNIGNTISTSNGTTTTITTTSTTTSTATAAPIASFSILWDDEDAFFRHMMDFYPWPALPSSPIIKPSSSSSVSSIVNDDDDDDDDDNDIVHTSYDNSTKSSSSSLLSIHDQSISSQSFIHHNITNTIKNKKSQLHCTSPRSSMMEYCYEYKQRLQSMRYYNQPEFTSSVKS